MTLEEKFTNPDTFKAEQDKSYRETSYYTIEENMIAAWKEEFTNNPQEAIKLLQKLQTKLANLIALEYGDDNAEYKILKIKKDSHFNNPIALEVYTKR